MTKLIRLVTAVMLLATPVAAQDILGPLQDFVDTLTEQPATAPKRPAPPVAPVADRPRCRGHGRPVCPMRRPWQRPRRRRLRRRAPKPSLHLPPIRWR